MNKLVKKNIEIGKRAYFAVGYNTTTLANLCMTIGVVVPFLLWQLLVGTVTLVSWFDVVSLPVIAVYWYTLVYVVNDSLDIKKDELKGIPKSTSRRYFGGKYILFLAACYIAALFLVNSFAHLLLLPLSIYAITLAAVSALHSKAGEWKFITIFIERFAKFSAPLALLFIATHDPIAKVMLLALCYALPFSFMFDYAYKGYFPDRLKMNSNKRYYVYAGYWMLLILCTVLGRWVSLNDLAVMSFYVGCFALVTDIANLLAPYLPLGFIDSIYEPVVAYEKRRLITYGTLNLVLILLGGLYAILR